jgi:hypothetical protein
MYENQRVAEMANEDLTSKRRRQEESALAAYAQLRLMEASQQKVEELKKARRLV